MKSSKKFLVIFILSLLVANIVLSGCRTKQPAEKKTAYDGVVLNYYKMFDSEDSMKGLIKEYEAAHPGLKINYKSFDNFDEYQKVILNQMAEGEGPDIFSMQNSWFASNYKKLSPMPQAFGTANDFLSTFVDVAYKDLVLPDKDGVLQVFALPMTVDTLALYYNRAHFEDRLATKGKPSLTWDGIKDDVSLLNKEDNSLGRFEVSGIAMGRGDNISRGVDILYLLFLQFGAKFYNNNISEATFAAQMSGSTEYPGMQALKLFTSFADPEQKNYSWNEYMVDDDSDQKELEAFAKGQVSMMVGFAYSYQDILNEITLLKSKGVDVMDSSDVKVAPIPQIFDPALSKDKRVTYANYFAETVSRNSKHSDIAWDFLIWLTMRENLTAYFEKVHKPASRRDMINDQKQDPIYGVFASQIGYAESFPVLDYYVYKNIFLKVIANANLNGTLQGDLLDAQNQITSMLPVDGLLNPEKKIVESSK